MNPEAGLKTLSCSVILRDWRWALATRLVL
jgi:hypothetical protein